MRKRPRCVRLVYLLHGWACHSCQSRICRQSENGPGLFPREVLFLWAAEKAQFLWLVSRKLSLILIFWIPYISDSLDGICLGLWQVSTFQSCNLQTIVFFLPSRTSPRFPFCNGSLRGWSIENLNRFFPQDSAWISRLGETMPGRQAGGEDPRILEKICDSVMSDQISERNTFSVGLLEGSLSQDSSTEYTLHIGAGPGL